MSEEEAGWHVYLLQSEKDGTFYTGMAIDVFERLKQHNAGKGAKYTRGRGPWKLIWKSVTLLHKDADAIERNIKKLSRKEKMKFDWFGYKGWVGSWQNYE